ncbi:MAG: DUF1722 domain-containing protein [candidate division Zixibacteria bacterium]|nr:DUF1722 domain-containing protein [candidate division Zixibacteria bacterium]
MNKFIRPNVIISKCLCGARCRWDRDRLDYPFVRTLRKYARIIPVCPEIEIGLGVPRDRIILVQRDNSIALYQSTTRRHLAQKMNRFSCQYLSDHTDVDGFILKHKSPSCGVRGVKLYESITLDARFTRTGTGLFAATVLERCSHLAITDEDQLERNRTREHWLTQLFTLATFRSVRKSHSFKRLRAFHTQHRLLLQTYHKRLTKDLDQALTQSDADTDNACAVIEQYECMLNRILATSPRRTSVIKPFESALEYYAQYLSTQDIKRFEHQLDSYRACELPLSELRKTVQIWAVRYDKRFTRQDAVFRPYPGPLASA